MQHVAEYLLLGIVLAIVLRGKSKGVDVYDAFLHGARQGAESAVGLLAPMSAMVLMLSLMNASGLTEIFVHLVSPITSLLHLPQEAAPMLILRPLSGSGALAAMQKIFEQYGVNSRAGRAAAVLMGSSETIVYTMTVYLGAAKVKKLPGVWEISLLSFLMGALVCGLLI